jgi:hypothetical protein
MRYCEKCGKYKKHYSGNSKQCLDCRSKVKRWAKRVEWSNKKEAWQKCQRNNYRSDNVLGHISGANGFEGEVRIRREA